MSFKTQFKNFNKVFYDIRNLFDLETKVSLKEFDFNDKLGSNEKIEEELYNILTSNYRKVLFLAPTSAGKTHIFCNLFNKIQEEKDEMDGFVSKQYINVLFTPKKIQNVANSNEYKNIKSIVANSKIELEDIEKGVNYSVVYDKSEELESVCETFCETLDNKQYVVNIVLDEAHQLVSSCNYRHSCIKKLERLIDLVNKTGGNVIYTTASMNSCHVLDFNEVIVCYPQMDNNIKKIESIINKTNQKNKDFIYNNIINYIKKGYIPCVRLNNKDLTQDFKDNIERLQKEGYKVATLNSSNKENNIVYETIINESTLINDIDVYFFTSILDEGTSIKSMSDGSKPANLLTIFYIDNKNANLDNYLQFNHRFRWERDLSVCLVSKHEHEEDENQKILNEIEISEQGYNYNIQTLIDIVKEEKKLYDIYFSSFQNFAIAKSIEAGHIKDENKRAFFIKNEVENMLNLKDFNDIPNHKNVFYYNEEIKSIEFDLKSFFNKIYEKYMLQFFHFDSNRKAYLEELFDCEVVEVEYKEEDNTLKLIDYDKEIFSEFLDEVISSEDLQEKVKINKELGIDNEERIKENESYQLLIRLSDYVDVENAATLLKNSIKNAKDKLKELNKKDLATFDNEKTLLVFLKTSEMAGTFEDVERLKRLVKSEYIHLFDECEKVGIEKSKFLDVVKSKAYEECVYYLREQSAINQNNLYLLMKSKEGACGLQKFVFENEIVGMTPGFVGREHALLLYFIDKIKNGNDRVVLTKEDTLKLASQMSKAMGNQYTRVGIEKMIILYFVCNIQEKTTKVLDPKTDKQKTQKTKIIVVRNLRKTH